MHIRTTLKPLSNQFLRKKNSMGKPLCHRRPGGHAHRLPIAVFLTILATSAATSVAAAAAAAPAHSKKTSNNKSCPKNPSLCNLATQQELDEVAQILNTKTSFMIGTVVIGGGTFCDVSGVSEDFETTCLQVPNSKPRNLATFTTCPPGFEFVIQTDCWARQRDESGLTITELTLMDSGAYRSTASCQVLTEGLPQGAIVEIYQTTTCSYYRGGGGVTSKADAAAQRATYLKAKGIVLP